MTFKKYIFVTDKIFFVIGLVSTYFKHQIYFPGLNEYLPRKEPYLLKNQYKIPNTPVIVNLKTTNLGEPFLLRAKILSADTRNHQ